jgi:2-hydroxychromene-2-carboxylate isomerase
MSLHAEFHFDFGSPNAYLSHRVLPQIERRTGVRFEYVPVLLGGLFRLASNRSPMEAFAGIPKKLAYEKLEMQRFIQRHSLTKFQRNPHFPVNTLKIMRGACAAQKLDCFAAYVEAVYVAMWEQGQNMAEDTVIRSALEAAGLDAPTLLATSQEADVKARLLDNTQRSYEQGAFGSPSFFVGEALFFGKDRLRDVEEEIARQQHGRGL